MRRRNVTAALGGGLLGALMPRRASAGRGGERAPQDNEKYLLNVALKPAHLRNLLIWDDLGNEWRVMRAGEAPSERTAFLILHLWADYCGPCREEFPLLRDLAAAVEDQYKGIVRFVYLSETDSSVAMDAFLKKNRSRMPKGPLYLDTATAISSSLRQDLPGSLPLPLTVVLDTRAVVRYAVIGSIASRQTELSGAIDRLVAAEQRKPS